MPSNSKQIGEADFSPAPHRLTVVRGRRFLTCLSLPNSGVSQSHTETCIIIKLSFLTDFFLFREVNKTSGRLRESE